MGADLSLFDLPGRDQRIHRPALSGLLLLTVAHVIFTWGHIGLFWGDQGRWLHEVERFAWGEAPYRDYYWAFPPLALWLLGGLARIFGPGTSVIWTVTSIVCVVIFVAYFRYASLLMQRPFVPGVVVGGLLLSTAYANWASAPLPSGMYSPAAPVGFLCLLAAVVLSLDLLHSPSLGYALGLGLCSGLAILAKHDFWLPSLYLMAVSSGVLFASRRSSSCFLAFSLCGAFGLTVLAGAAIVAMQSGWTAVAGIPGGFGQGSEFLGRGFPSWERITVEGTVLALLALALLLCLMVGGEVSPARFRRVTIVTAAVAMLGVVLHLTMTYTTVLRLRVNGVGPLAPPAEQFLAASDQSGVPLFRLVGGWLGHRLQDHLFPALLPVALTLLIAARWKRLHPAPLRNTVMFLAGLCLTSRVRRGFEHVEWYHFLLELPSYLLAVPLFVPEWRWRQRGLRLALPWHRGRGAALLLVIGRRHPHPIWRVRTRPHTKGGGVPEGA